MAAALYPASNANNSSCQKWIRDPSGRLWCSGFAFITPFETLPTVFIEYFPKPSTLHTLANNSGSIHSSSFAKLKQPDSSPRMWVGNLHSVALIDLYASLISASVGWEPSFCSLDRLINQNAHCCRAVGNLHSVALIDLPAKNQKNSQRWEPSFCSLDRLIARFVACRSSLGTFILQP